MKSISNGDAKGQSQPKAAAQGNSAGVRTLIYSQILINTIESHGVREFLVCCILQVNVPSNAQLKNGSPE